MSSDLRNPLHNPGPLSSEQLRILRHALGVAQKRRPPHSGPKAYRSHYTAEHNEDLEQLYRRGLLYRLQDGSGGTLERYFVTVLGAVVALEPPEFLDAELLRALHWASAQREAVDKLSPPPTATEAPSC